MRKDKFEDFDFIDFNESRSEESTVMADMIGVLAHHRKWFILSVAVCLLVGFIYVRSTPKTFSRTATILVKDEQGGGNMGESAAFRDVFSLGNSKVDNEMGFFKSKRLMMEVTRQLRLDVSYKERNGLRKRELYNSTPFTVVFQDAEPGQEISLTATAIDGNRALLSDFVLDENDFDEVVTVQMGDTTDTPVGKVVVASTLFMNEEYMGKPVYVKKGNRKNVSDNYNANLQVEVVDKSSLINLTIEDENIGRAEDVLNTLIEAYKNDAIEDKNKVVINTANFIKDRLTIIEADLGVIDTEIEDYKRENKLTDVTSESALLLQNSSRLGGESLSIENEVVMAEYIKDYLQDNSKTAELIPSSIGINDNGIQNQINEYNTTLTKKNKLMANSSANNPIVREMNASLVSMRASISKAVDNLVAGLKMQVRNMKRKELENMNRKAFVPTQQKYVISIERQQKIKEELYLYLLNKKEESELQLSITESNCRIVDPADGPDLPVSPRKAQVLLICILLGFTIPALWLYIRSLLNTTVQTKRDLKAGVSVPFLGEIPLKKGKREKDIVVKEGSREYICEAFKILRDNLDFMDTEKKAGGKVVQVTSFNPDSGKTFIVANLAMSMALSNAKVIVLDLDLRKGSLTKNSGIGTKEKGMSAYLSGKVNRVEEIIRPYEEGSRLDIITSGALPPNPAELLKSDKLDELIAGLKETYDYILLDNPPYGMVVDASLCARLVDQSVYIVRAGMFDKRLLPELQELYDSGKMKHLSVVLNAVNYEKGGYGYGYGYVYGYGYGYGNDNDGKPKKTAFCKRIFGI